MLMMWWKNLIEKSAENGIDIYRIFDALNDVRNLSFTTSVKKTGKKAQMTICYTISDTYTIEYYKELGKNTKWCGFYLCERHGRILTPARY